MMTLVQIRERNRKENAAAQRLQAARAREDFGAHAATQALDDH